MFVLEGCMLVVEGCKKAVREVYKFEQEACWVLCKVQEWVRVE